ncbi:MAG TPA: hypothetical protein VJ771_06730 [Candidatus Nitrosotalea sp.]|nr:hypothetical protein [Candidatus Nitrosotalea sp.]
MKIKYCAILLGMWAAVKFYPKKSFAPVIPDSNSTIDANQTAFQPHTFGNPDFMMITMGVVIGVSLIILVLLKLNRRLGSTSNRP